MVSAKLPKLLARELRGQLCRGWEVGDNIVTIEFGLVWGVNGFDLDKQSLSCLMYSIYAVDLFVFGWDGLERRQRTN